MAQPMPRDATLDRQPTVRKLVPLLLSWFSANARDLPWRHTPDPYAIWVSEIMLQQTQVRTVIPYWLRWMRKMPTIRSVAKASPAKLHKLWEGLGYYTRVRNLQQASQQIVAQHKGKFPGNLDEILALAGIGRYTAGAIASIAFNQPCPVLDGNVIRVLTRLFGITANPRDKKTNALLWRLATGLVIHASRITSHASACSHLNQSLMELGALICTPRSPNCAACPVKKLCEAFRGGQQEQLPNLAKRKAPIARRFIAFVIERDGRFLVRQRPVGVVNAHLWEFPNVEIRARHSEPRQAAGSLGLKLCEETPLVIIRHSITRYRLTLEAWRAEKKGRSHRLSGEWLAPVRLCKLAFAAAHKKTLAKILEQRRSL